MPRRREPLRILCYAVNGLGLGHLTRLTALCRQLRRLCAALELPAEILFLTSSEGDSLALLHGFASFKIPSKTLAAECRLEPHRYRKLAKQWIWNAINLISPEILIVDTFPGGSFSEIPSILDLGSKNVFIYRAVRPAEAKQMSFQAALAGYDLILMPQEAGENDSPVPETLRHRVAPVGPILLRSRLEIYPKDEARLRLGLTAEAPAIYVSTGGGGDRDAEAFYVQMVDAAKALPAYQFVFGAGLLYRGREFPAPNVVWTRRPALMECFAAFDAAVTAGGFNSVWELMHVGVPCVFLPRPRTFDDQETRVQKCVDAGAGLLAESLSSESLAAALSKMLSPERHAQMSAAARDMLPASGALDAAEETLAVAIDRDKIEEAALLIDDDTLFAATQSGLDEDAVLTAAAILWRRSGAPRDGEGADDSLAAAVRYLKSAPPPVGKAIAALRRADVDDAPLAPDELALRAMEELAGSREQEGGGRSG